MKIFVVRSPLFAYRYSYLLILGKHHLNPILLLHLLNSCKSKFLPVCLNTNLLD